MQKHILIVDDEITTSVALEKALLTCGYRVSVAMNAADGLKLVHHFTAKGDRIDLVIVDIQMPEMSGSGTAGKISGSSLVRIIKTDRIPVPVFVLSGELDKKFLINLLMAGATGSFERAWPATGCESCATCN